MNHSSAAKAQKGWLSRWTRKQWSRHWFVLKNGSLTYYRGPAAELCSFLDGVLDLSLIKQIEVQQESAGEQNHHHQHNNNTNNGSVAANNHANHLSHHHHLMNHHQANQTSHNNAQSGPHFTFSLRMWNGECHLLGACSQAERALWLEAIKAQSSGEADDEAATDSASSSDSSPASNLSAKSADVGRPLLARGRYQQQHQDQLCLDKLANSLRSAIKRREQDLLLESAKARPIQLSEMKRQDEAEAQQQSNKINPSQTTINLLKGEQDSKQQVGGGGASALIKHNRQAENLYLKGSGEEHKRSSGEEAQTSEGQEDSHSKQELDKREQICNKQKKRVTFDLSLSSQHQLTSSSASSCTDDDSSSSDSEDSSLSSSVSSASLSESSDSSDGEQNVGEPNADDQVDQVCKENQPQEKQSSIMSNSLVQVSSEENLVGDLLDLNDDDDDDEDDDESSREQTGSAFLAQVGQNNSLLQLRCAPADGAALAGELPLKSRDGATSELEEKLEQAQNNIGLLEKKLTNSYANYNKLEISFKKIQAELVKGDECHKSELSKLQSRVDELTRELATSEMKLVETRDKLLKCEQKLGNSAAGETNPIKQQQTQAKPISHNRTLNWLRASQQVAQPLLSQSLTNSQHHQHQPLLLMHHVKHTLAINQQTLGIKLLNHSKQIQRKLNELELKVDKMQQTSSPTTTTTTTAKQESDCVQ